MVRVKRNKWGWAEAAAASVSFTTPGQKGSRAVQFKNGNVATDYRFSVSKSSRVSNIAEDQFWLYSINSSECYSPFDFLDLLCAWMGYIHSKGLSGSLTLVCWLMGNTVRRLDN